MFQLVRLAHPKYDWICFSTSYDRIDQYIEEVVVKLKQHNVHGPVLFDLLCSNGVNDRFFVIDFKSNMQLKSDVFQSITELDEVVIEFCDRWYVAHSVLLQNSVLTKAQKFLIKKRGSKMLNTSWVDNLVQTVTHSGNGDIVGGSKVQISGSNNASITINGKSYNGKNITIKNNKVLIDGVVQESDEKTINVTVTGNVEILDVDSCDLITVNGSANSVKSANGSIKIGGDVTGNVSTTNGSVKVGKSISGNANTVNGSISKEFR